MTGKGWQPTQLGSYCELLPHIRTHTDKGTGLGQCSPGPGNSQNKVISRPQKAGQERIQVFAQGRRDILEQDPAELMQLRAVLCTECNLQEGSEGHQSCIH